MRSRVAAVLLAGPCVLAALACTLEGPPVAIEEPVADAAVPAPTREAAALPTASDAGTLGSRVLSPPGCFPSLPTTSDQLLNACNDTVYEVFDTFVRLPFYDGGPLSRTDLPGPPGDGG